MESGQIKSAELNSASGSFGDMLERLESLGFAEVFVLGEEVCFRS